MLLELIYRLPSLLFLTSYPQDYVLTPPLCVHSIAFKFLFYIIHSFDPAKNLIPKDITLRPPSHPPAHHVLNGPLALPQLRSLAAHLNSALDIIDVTRWTGDPTSASFISGQLRLLGDCLTDARGALKGGEDVVLTEGGAQGGVDTDHNMDGDGADDTERPRWQLKWFEEDGDSDPAVRFTQINEHGLLLIANNYQNSFFDLQFCDRLHLRIFASGHWHSNDPVALFYTYKLTNF